MRRRLFAFAALAASVGTAKAGNNDVAVWAIASSKHATNGRVIVFRFARQFRAGFEKSALPDRVILAWRYKSESGLPAGQEREAMDHMEDLLAPAVEKPGVAVLALVSTGEDLREWIYYTRSEQEFLNSLNKVLAGAQRFPIEVHTASDPQWSTYERFRKGVKE